MATYRRAPWRVVLIAGLLPVLQCADGGSGPNSSLFLTDLAVGQGHTCGLMTDSVAVCWGYNGSRELGADSAAYASPRPVRVNTSTRFTRVTAAAGFSCGLTKLGRELCWGTLYDYDVGYWSAGAPVSIDTTHTFALVAAGQVSCALTTQHDPYCWGTNYEGDLG